ncbi:FLOT1 protein, partial [Molothrus ater]|nr:FLOT1 protein [Molothrus ater]
QEIYKDRQKFSDQVFRVASSDLVNMGISVVSYTLKDVHDEQVMHLGMAGDSWGHIHSGHTWDALGDAQGQDRDKMGTRWHSWDSWGRLIHTWDTSGGMGISTLSHPCPSPDGFVSCPPQAARSQQAIAAQRGEVALVERAQRVQLQEQEVGRRRQELEATVRKPAEAERYRLERLAEAQR